MVGKNLFRLKNNEMEFVKDKDNLHIPIGPTCNNYCIFCKESDRENRKLLNSKYTPELVEEILRRYQGKLEKVIFTSGEPTLNSNLCNLINKSKSLQYNKISLTTNGRMLSYKGYSENLIISGLNEIIISIHGHTQKLHDSLSRVKGSFAQTIKGIKNISKLKEKYNINLIIAVTLNKRNYIYFGDIVNFLFNFNISEITFNVVQPLGKLMEKNFYKLMPKYSDTAKIIEDFYLNNYSIFLKKRKNCNYRVISIIDLPFCQSKILTDYMGYGEKRIVEDIKKEKDNFINELETKAFDDNKDLKLKRDFCNSCIYNSYCNGIYNNYIKNYGWSEFYPITD